MIVEHINSKERFDLSEPVYTKLNGVYGYLTHNCIFITSVSEAESENLSSQFKTIKS